MAIAWIFPISIIVSLVTVFISTQILLISNLIFIGQTLLVYILLPLYLGWISSSETSGALNPRMILMQFMLFLLSAMALYYALPDQSLLGWLIYSFITTIIITIDLMGSTPVYKSNLHHHYEITLDADLCRGDASCVLVCPRNCFEIVDNLASIPNKHRCVQCGACIVQCPFDALFFSSSTGIIPAETIRKTKLNMMGDRVDRK